MALTNVYTDLRSNVSLACVLSTLPLSWGVTGSGIRTPDNF